jgi:hypothetical protein
MIIALAKLSALAINPKVFVLLVTAIAGGRPDSLVQHRAAEYAPIIWEEAKQAGENPVLIASMVRIESRFNPNAISTEHATGLMQVTPRLWHAECADLLPNKHEPWAQLRCGIRSVKVWREACRKKGHYPRAWLGGYNAGYSMCGVRTMYVHKILNIRIKRKDYASLAVRS